MALITKDDLRFGYRWTAVQEDDPTVSGPTDSTLFNRNEGYEVLYLINKIAEIGELKQKESGLKIERMIKMKMPSNIVGQENVRRWIYDNWNM